MGLLGLSMAWYGAYRGILSGLTKSTDHPNRAALLLGAQVRLSETSLQILLFKVSKPRNLVLRVLWGWGMSGAREDQQAHRTIPQDGL